MLRIGIVGAENSHTVAIARTLNIDKKVPGCRVVCVWGEAPKYAKDAAARGEIPEIVKRPEDMIGKVDAACVDHRHPKFHLPAVRPLLEAKIPLFVDKPYCYRVREGKEFLARAHALKVPVCSFSVLPKQAAFGDLKKQVRKLGRIISIVSTGSCDIRSKYGGVFFYGIHQVDAVIELFGMDVTHVELRRQGDSGVGILYYKDGKIVTLNLVKGGSRFNFLAYGEKGVLWCKPESDPVPYLASTKTWVDMIRTGREPIEHRRMLAPVAVLEALDKALKTGKRVKVGAF